MSGRPAKKFHIEKRGTIAKGNYADIVVFDPKQITDASTVDNPYQYAKGIDWVLVNGKPALENGTYNGARAGQVIRRKSSLFEF